MRKVVLSVKMQRCYEVIKSVCDGNISRRRAEVILNVSYRTNSRYLKGYKEQGKSIFIHDNSNNICSTAIPSELKECIILKYKDPYSPIFNANFAIVTEFVRDFLGVDISESSV